MKLSPNTISALIERIKSSKERLAFILLQVDKKEPSRQENKEWIHFSYLFVEFIPTKGNLLEWFRPHLNVKRISLKRSALLTEKN